ncbi:DNA (cytosine-5)-methyltransferase 1 [Amycolatopsis pretoriensis]|uniref:DNA (cytosine-5-)-methyltransferase n=1 Tax=Amycolatopsis pretoriensis TaxID=218821 RepID=A0A1H5RAA2_9PSEU|nr:DNA cytosine methyltransferase [Amycolatopsis pretoriensis]SEF34337.1 DNA (cytosine-5)-methyltransferase 1 [Amycolatopsis pretoriensis]
MITFGSLFTGTAALDHAAGSVLGCVPAWFCDNDKGASKLLAYHYPHIPNLGDITAVDWSTVEPVDVLGGGFPCQDVSAAGRRVGMAPGTRSGLWSHMAFAIATIRPRLVVVENVRGLLSAKAHSHVEPCTGCLGDHPKKPALRALGAVLGDLADIGYDAVWCGVRASDVGAPHQRFRVFVAAQDTNRTAGEERRKPAPGQAEGRSARADAGGRSGTPLANAAGIRHGGPGFAWSGWGGLAHDDRVVADTSGDRRGQGEPEATRFIGRHDVAERGVRATADSDRDGREVVERFESRVGPRDDVDGRRAHSWGAYAPAIARWAAIIGRPAPDPTVLGQRGGQVLNPALVEWMMGLPAGYITAVPGLSRNDMLRLGGNGVVPQQAAAALRRLVSLLDGAVAA